MPRYSIRKLPSFETTPKFMIFSLNAMIRRIFSKERKAEVTLDVSDDDWVTFGKIRDCLKKLDGASKGRLELEIVGMSRINPTVVLSILDLLTERKPTVQLGVNVRTNLIDGSLIFALLADKLHIRKGAWFQYAGIVDLQKKVEEDDDGEGWKNNRSAVNTVKEPAAVTDYRTMTSILGEYLPLAEFKGKRLPLKETLDEFGLIRGQGHDMELTRQFKPATR